MMYNIFDTEEEALKAQEYDFKKFMGVFSDGNGYDNSTNYWDIPRQRITDKKWVYLVCEYSDVKHVTEEYNEDWFDDEE